MRMRFSLLLASLATGWSASALSMDLHQAYLLSLAQDPTVRAAQAATAAGRERVPQARAQLLANVSASAAASANRLDARQEDAALERRAYYPSDNQTLTLRQPLLRPLQAAGLRQARAQVQDSEARLQQEIHQLSVRVTEAYFNALLAEDQQALMRMQSESYAVQLDASRKALAAGAGMRTDVDEAQARLDLSRAAELQARQQVDYSRRALEALTQQPVTRLAALDTQRLALQEPQPARVEDWVGMAERQSAELQSLRAQLEAAREDIARARAGYLPTLDLVGQWQRSTSENVLNIENRFRRASVGVQLNVPLFSAGFVQSTIRQALAEQDRLEASIEALRLDLALRIHKEHRGMTEGVARVQALEQAVRSAEQLSVSSRRSFQTGSRTLVDVFNAEQRHMAALRDLAQARYEYLVSRVRLQALSGAEPAALVREISAYLQP